MKRFDIKFYENENMCIVFSTSYLSPLKYIPMIENELSLITNNELEVIFDFFLSNGNTSERYGTAYFDGKHFVGNSFKYIDIKKSNKIRKLSAQYYRDSKDEVDFSFVNSVQKKMILRGIAI